jgi:FkbM family methyltransferase
MLIDFRQLFPKYGIKPKGVLHIGANRGEEAPVYSELGIKKVIWFEGNPELYETLNSNVSKFEGQTAYYNCIGDYDGEAVLHISNNGSQSSSILELGTHKVVHPEVHYVKDITVKMNKIESLFPWKSEGELKDCDFLNIDIQGAELKALKGMGEIITQFKWAYLEVNKAELYEGCALVEDIDFYLGAYGFQRVETMWCGNTSWGDALYVKG